MKICLLKIDNFSKVKNFLWLYLAKRRHPKTSTPHIQQTTFMMPLILAAGISTIRRRYGKVLLC